VRKKEYFAFGMQRRFNKKPESVPAKDSHKVINELAEFGPVSYAVIVEYFAKRDFDHPRAGE
jgi:hypothetical protein